MTALIVALVAGAVVGLALGGLGGGGSVLAVPALIYPLGFTPAAATTAGLLIVIATSLTGLVAHAREGGVRWRTGGLFAAAGIVPAAVAGALSVRVPAGALTAGFAVLAAVAAVRMLRPRTGPGQRAGTDAGGAPAGRVARTGAGLGAVTGFLGVGGGFLVVPALVTVVALPMTAAVGTSLLVITVNSVAALVTRLATPTTLDWAVIAPFTATAVLGAWDGRRLAAKVSTAALQRIFGAALLAVAVFMLIDAVA
ncbi:sulfite exporter TauE/SafE family protein [Streptomyces sp. NBC_00053]|uniref:sulfite exporter TauE/SafE family protein n=1 Tax=unclassified Streptomyces TaxID=2593676 RepID=UPI000F5B8A73|nr:MULTISPECIES: sulfite exporter TauE/SafE family protein [unclassified Streptomyces]WSG55089.1 sulfite exporter TauE/SafE family protein [Streptomyces sp. NBC_01732]WSX05805.1 sulfite exporter TauE/SafE family protein [Streptomyces sp. NBC_00987]MCX4391938.1 sulfite exporter TauE/SafE family protein [Streptomyces sp. NBC_01767]MCX5104062.1 sulfite exporter TauE/SafE family protein [Streptomyces sp. NBC_00439]MCX5164888.1 sulfite exporter TauE/SafE family protein [Streptomyces sp. NBC_00305]